MADEPNQQAISDDQELAKVLAGVNQQADTAIDMDQPVAPLTPAPIAPLQDTPVESEEASLPEPEPAVGFDQPLDPQPVVASSTTSMPATGELDGIKLEALNELRPLVDKLNVSAEEKFDTYLLLLRSTDDKELIAPAHDAAKAIEDEARRAQALLDIIKEIDFLSQNNK